MMNGTEQKENSYGHVLKYTGVFGGVQGLNILMGLVRNKLVALLLGPAGMGLASLYNSVVTFVSQATNLGISFSAIRHMSEIFDSGDRCRIEGFVATVRAWSVVAAVIGMVACVAAAPLLDVYVMGGDGHSPGIMALAPVVAMTALAGGESAILKGARRLRALAVMQVFMVAVSLAVSVPVYWLFGMHGIIPVIILIAAANLAATLHFSLRAYPIGGLRALARPGVLSSGVGMVRLGLAFILAGVFGSGAEMVVRAYLNSVGGVGAVGLYNAGYVITVTYAGMVFSAMETDYFPRLSAVNHDTAAVNLAANRQIEVSLLIVAPMLTLMITALPLLIPLLYSGRFAPVAPMAQVTVLAMYAKAVTTPVEYITLAKGHSKAYLALELAYDVMFAVLVVVCFGRWGLTGAGVALLASYAVNTAIVFAYARIRYAYKPSRPVCRYAAVLVPLGFAAYAATFIGCAWLRVAAGLAATALSAGVSVYVLQSKTEFMEKIRNRLFRRK